MFFIAAGNEVYVAYRTFRGNKKGHVEYLPIAILHHTRGLLDTHGLGKFEQEFLTWIGVSRTRFQLLQTGRSGWDAARTTAPTQQVDAVRPLLLALGNLILQFKNDPTRGKSKN